MAAFLLVLTGCSTTTAQKPKTELVQLEVNRAEDLPFNSGSGRATVVFEETGIIDILVLAKGLNPEKTYEITLVKDSRDVVIFGPKENMKIRFGTMVGETLFKPNPKGELFVSMRNPLRMAEDGTELKIKVTTKEGKEILTSASFVIKKQWYEGFFYVKNLPLESASSMLNGSFSRVLISFTVSKCPRMRTCSSPSPYSIRSWFPCSGCGIVWMRQPRAENLS